ncbi:MAG: hypothetical protein QM736_26100 [Vicinamibacterales bacterium]
MGGNVTDLRYYSVNGKARLIAGTDVGGVQKVDIQQPNTLTLQRMNWRELQHSRLTDRPIRPTGRIGSGYAVPSRRHAGEAVVLAQRITVRHASDVVHGLMARRQQVGLRSIGVVQFAHDLLRAVGGCGHTRMSIKPLPKSS